jgi:hypothetical protein
MLRVPCSYPIDSPRCDMRLPEAALSFRRMNGLMVPERLGAVNITAWLYRDQRGGDGIHVNPNTPKADLIREHGRAKTWQADVGFHSEFHAAEWFRVRPELRVLHIFSERIPCREQCGPFLRHYFPGVPWYYYYDRRSWIGNEGEILKWASAALTTAYGL